MTKKVGIWSGIIAVVVSSAILQATNPYSLQQALNLLAGNTRAPYTQYSAQQAANIMLANQYARAEETTILPTVTFVWDDVARELWGASDSLLINPTGNIKMRIRDIMHQFDIDGGLAFETQNVIYGDTVSTSLSISMVRALVNRGWEVGTVGWDEISGMYHGSASLLAQGYTNAQADTFYNNINRAVLAQRDTLGLGHPRWISHSNSSSSWITNQAAARNGIEFGFQSSQTVTLSGSFTNANGYGVRPNELYPLDCARWGMWGTGGAGGYPVSALMQQRVDRYQILQSLGEASDSSACYKTIRRAMQTKGLVVFIGHKPSTWEATLEGQNGFYALMQYLDTLRDAGRIQILTPSEAADYYYNKPLSPVASVIPTNFEDLDGDTHLDWWFANRAGFGGSFVAADTARLAPWRTSTSGHNGKAAMSLNWTGEDGSSSIIAGQTANDAWEGSRAVLSAIPPAGGGWTVKFECWVIADTTAAGWTVGTAPQQGDTIGVVFYGPAESFMNRWGTGNPNMSWVNDTNGSGGPGTSMGGYISSAPGNLIRLGYRHNADRAGTNKEWAHLVATWDVPEFSDYLFVSIYKTAQAPAKGLVISDYSVTFYRRDVDN